MSQHKIKRTTHITTDTHTNIPILIIAIPSVIGHENTTVCKMATSRQIGGLPNVCKTLICKKQAINVTKK